MDSQDDDIRSTELETLEAIYPEIQYPDRPKDPFTFDLELPVQPETPVTVTFPAAAVGNADLLDPAATAAAATAAAVAAGQQQQADVDSLNVSHLPSLRLRISLPKGYPEDRSASVQIATDPPWLSQEALRRLEDDLPRLWEDMGRDMVAFAYIDHVQRAADDVFGAITPEGTLAVDPQHKLAVLDYDIKAKKAAFEKGTFDCGVCLDPKKGSKCHKMLDCGHIFCLQCLQDFYNDAITEGNISVVRCLTPNCAKERAAAQTNPAKDGGKRSKKSKTALSPSELLQIGLGEDAVKRYVTLKYKTELESDKNTIYCPRQWCNGAARSKKHRKPSGLDFVEGTSETESDSEADEDATNGEDPDKEKKKKKKKEKKKKFNRGDFLSVCEDCGFAFCSQCLLSWHGEFVICTPKRDGGELTEEEKASLEYVKLHTSPCPTCNAPAQKTHGCNHMICSRCESHFCYLCSAWLNPGNPYQHYNEAPNGKLTSCYMRLWELEGGDGNDVGIGFVGGAQGGEQGPAAAAAVVNDAIADAQAAALAELEDSDTEDEDPQAQQVPQPDRPRGGNEGEIIVAREGPLVLRLMGNQLQNQPPPPPPVAPPAAGRGAGRGQHNPQRGGLPPRGRGRGRGGRGAQAGGRPAPRAGRRGPVVNNGPAARNNPEGVHIHRPAPAAAPPPPPEAPAPQDEANGNDEIAAHAALDPAQEAWIRNFVRMALRDEEDGASSDDDDDDDDQFAFQ